MDPDDLAAQARATVEAEDAARAARPSSEPRPPRRPRTPRETPDPPKGGSGGSSRRSSPRASQRDRIKSGLIETYGGVGAGVSMIGMMKGDPGLIGSSMAMVENAESAADAWLTLADNNPAVMRALSAFVEGSSFAAILIVHAPMIMPLLQSRGVFGPDMQAAQAAQVAAAFGMAQNGNGEPSPDAPPA